MALEKAVIPFLVAMMLVTGVCNTLLTKYQDNICVRDCDAPKPRDRRLFEQPVVQTVQMFIGEMGCWLFVGLFTLYAKYGAGKSAAEEGGYQPVNGHDDGDAASIRSNTPIIPIVKVMSKKAEDRIPLTGFRVLLLALPAVCDICGTTLMNVGLLFVEPSIYQMTRGALVLFVGLFSVLFLRRKLHFFQWFALVTVVAGVAIVGLAGWLYHKGDAPESVGEAAILAIREVTAYFKDEMKQPGAGMAVIGVLLIAGAQIFTASQFVLEEYILEKYALEPLKVVGWEGIFGFSVTVIGMLVLYFAIGRTDAGRYGYFDVVEGWREVTTYKGIWVSSILIMISIGGFNFFGLSVTRTVSATSRSTIDTCRTLFIWIVSLFLGWENFKVLQVLGFALLVYGTFLFNGLVHPPLKSCYVREVEELLPEEPIEHS
ncbi:hypothetical protein BJ875DRAFT_443344 [Amylocarpus encephaloides]|uniref:Integral membrane protein n=1 Tax=Amylocarpus encephaloides TaxID=45428 RepID=A0A9P7YE93_9HELO|nr:hypothetical protein BJ875DRAFT_443344 [Amylocarpus encephaloides]